MTRIREISYRPRGRFFNKATGAHPAPFIGGDGVYRDQAPFITCPDARRLDIRATITNPYGETYVRRFEQRQSIDVLALVDLSGSMRYGTITSKLALASEFCLCLAFSATRIGDRFTLIGCDHRIRADAFFPPARSRSTAINAAQRIKTLPCYGENAMGLLTAARILGTRRKMVFLISDFRLPFDFLAQLFDALSQHDLVPVVLLDPAEDEFPKWGLIEAADLENRRRRLIVMRPALRRRWIEKNAQWRKALWQLSGRYGRAPVVIRGSVDPHELSRHLMAG
ncbi:MAG TPA: VWA domain-containing protein [Methylocella sp.]|nr:VWA domain-containing protein [Methylocella sp.]